MQWVNYTKRMKNNSIYYQARIEVQEKADVLIVIYNKNKGRYFRQHSRKNGRSIILCVSTTTQLRSSFTKKDRQDMKRIIF